MADKLKTVGIFAVGAGIGAGVALLLAPRSGKQTRRRLHNSAIEARNRIEDLQEDIRSCMTDWVDDASETIASGIARGKATAKESGDCVLHALDSVRECMEDGKDRLEKYIRSAAS